MPTSSQSQILSVVDYQLLQQQQASGQDGITAQTFLHPSLHPPHVVETKRRRSKDERRPSTGRKDDDDKYSPPPPNLSARRRSSNKSNDGVPTSRTPQRNDVLHMPVINLNTTDESIESSQYHHRSFNNDNYIETEYILKQFKPNSARIRNNSSSSDLDNEEENQNLEQKSRLLDDNSRRLLVLGTIRPSRSFYKELPECDVEHLMEYFHRMRNAKRRISIDEINQELKTQFTEYKPKIFYDSARVTKFQVHSVEKLFEPFADKLRADQAELMKLDNPFRFIIKPINNDTPLITIPREYNDCILTLLTRTDPLRKSDLITEIIRDKLLNDVKANSLDISYFPGGVNYDVPREEIDETGQMKLETYQKLKKRLNARKVWYFTGPPEKKPNAVLAIIPPNVSINIDHQSLLNCLIDYLKTLPINEKLNIQQKILSIEFIPLSCILDSYDISNQFIIDCDTIDTKQQLIDKPLKFNLNKQSITIELRSYDETIQREYEKSVKAEKYRELIKIHDESIKRKSTK